MPQKKTSGITNLTKNFLGVILLLLLLAGVFASLSKPFEQKREISLTELISAINQEKVKKIEVTGNDVEVLFADDSRAHTMKEVEVSLSETLLNYGVEKEKLARIEIQSREDRGILFWLGPVSLFLFPLLFFALFFWMIFRQARIGAMQAFNFGRARARLFGAEGHGKQKITFKDVAGQEEAKEELKEVVDFLKNPQKFLKIGARIPRGVLLMGPAGVGKTLLARAVAGESNVPFFSISGSEFVEMFVGVGASVTGDTPVLVKKGNSVRLLPVGEFVDQYYSENESNIVKPVENVQTLGFKSLETNFYGARSSHKKFFGGSQWVQITSVFRHKVNEIYEIHYRGGIIKTTGDHSIFVRSGNMVASKAARDLREGDVLVNLPFKVRGRFISGFGTTHEIRAHEFKTNVALELDVYGDRLLRTIENYQFALAHRSVMSQEAIAHYAGVSQATIKNWQLGYHQPRFLNNNLIAAETSPRIPLSIELMKLLGYYTAEGRTSRYFTQFIFGLHEKELHQDCARLIKRVFSIEPACRGMKETNSFRITLSSPYIAKFFEENCGNGSHRKHIPPFLWNLPKEYFLAYLEGFTLGDGYTDKEGRLAACSVSRQLILELTWLCAMHGMQVSVHKAKYREDRIIKSKPLPGGNYWIIKFGKTSHPFIKNHIASPYQFKKPIIKKIIKRPWSGYVYDLCGCENEAFFGGEKPILLHNSRVRDLFATAKKAAPAILFIDELDAVGRHRGAGLGGGHDEREQTLNQILVEMDGFERDTNVIVMSATNRPDILDPALLRPGRFDRKVVLDLPDVNGREEVLKIHAEGKPLASDANLREIAERTPGFSGADLANVMNEAAILAARRNFTQIHQKELLEAIEKVMLGPERKSHILSKKEKEVAAYHEAGHALVAATLPRAEAVRKISIVSRGPAAGYTLQLPAEDRHLKAKKEFIDELAVLLGGWSAEKVIFRDITTGAANDLEKASQLARRLIKEYGMSETLGPVVFGEKEELVFLGKEVGEQRNYSEKTAMQIDKEVTKLIANAQKTAERIIRKKRKMLAKIAKALVEKETIEREEFERIVGAKKKR